MRRNTLISDSSAGGVGTPAGIILSIAFHVAIIAAVALLSFQTPLSSDIIAAGEGEGGEGGGGAIEVGVADASSILSFAKPETVSYVGDTSDPLNNVRLESTPREDEAPDEVLPKSDKETDPKAMKTDQPVVNREERIFTGKEERGGSENNSIVKGNSYGSPTPAQYRGGIAIGQGSGFGAGTGLPGGSAYGRLIQSIFSRNYNVGLDDASNPHFVIVTMVIDRSGTILRYNLKQTSPLNLVNKAVERALIASNPLPPVPVEFRPGVSTFTTEVWFKYPK